MYCITRYDINGKHYLMKDGEVICFKDKEKAEKTASMFGIPLDYVERIKDKEEIKSIVNGEIKEEDY